MLKLNQKVKTAIMDGIYINGVVVGLKPDYSNPGKIVIAVDSNDFEEIAGSLFMAIHGEALGNFEAQVEGFEEIIESFEDCPEDRMYLVLPEQDVI